MSGPKIVRVRTRAERQAEAQAEISRVEAAVRRWERQVRADCLATVAEIDVTAGRLAELTRRLEADQFDVIARQAPQEIEFLARDLERRRHAEAERRAHERTRERRLAKAAASVLRSSRDRGRALPADIARSLEQAASGRLHEAGAIETAIAGALEVFADCGDRDGPSDGARDLKERLRTEVTQRTLADWLAELPAKDEPVAAGLDADLARFELDAGPQEAAPFAERAARITAEASDERRRLLYESLRVDLAAAFRAWRAQEGAREALAVLASELEAIEGSTQAAALERSIEGALTEPGHSTAAMTELHQNAQAWLSQHRAAMAAEARRDAVLTGLAAVGYEVREGMAGLWSQGGRLVLRRGDSPDVGVEISGNPSTGRVQVRAVGLEAGPDTWDHGRDVDIEQRFCGEVRELGGHLEQQGVQMSIDRSTPVGAHPLRIVRSGDARDAQRREVDSRNNRVNGQRN